MPRQQHPPRIESKGRARTRSLWASLLAPLLLVAIDAGAAANARERISCMARDGCLFGKDLRKPMAGLTCHSRRSHARSFYFCASGAIATSVRPACRSAACGNPSNPTTLQHQIVVRFDAASVPDREFTVCKNQIELSTDAYGRPTYPRRS
jgi:hypothetical protein